jgi:3-deoxy-D-manno-octulosonic-acid transferase
VRALYSFFIQVLAVLMPIAGIFHSKARLWSQGRRQWRNRLSDWRKGNPGELIWMHCASLGEFEQGRPVLEALRAQYPHKKLLLTFFSPSGFEVRKHYSGVDGVFYLPADTTANARDFLAIVKPSRAMMVKYEYWPNFFLSCKQHHVPLYIISGIFRPDQRFFGMFSSFWRPVLAAVNHFFVQNESSVKLLESIGFTNVTLAGDTRFDRVMQLKQSPRSVEWIREFKGEGLLVVGGSTWPADEDALAMWLSSATVSAKLVVVPHEVDKASVSRLMKLFPDAVLWSKREATGYSSSRVCIVDEIGWLSSIYTWADICWIGGGFGAGIHNTLEAAAWHKPVLFGPRYLKFDEACGLIAAGGAISTKDERVGAVLLGQLTADAAVRDRMGQQAGLFVERGAGATAKILNELAMK